MSTPAVDELRTVVDALREWQDDAAPMQLHPGDIGWFWRFGQDATAAAVRVWHRGGDVVAVGLLDGPRLLRLTTAPDARRDRELAERLADDITLPEHGVLPAGTADVEAPAGALLEDLLDERGWGQGQGMTPLRLDLARPVEVPPLRVDVVGPELARERSRVQRASFAGSTFTEERWHAMAGGPAYADARCLLASDDGGTAVAAVTVWSAGVGRPGLVEPLGTHPEHRGRGYGRAVTLAGAAALRDMGSSSAVVCTFADLAGAVATYRAAGFEQLPDVHDRHRAAA